MSKELETFMKLKENCFVYSKEFIAMEKGLKALEIIKKKEINIHALLLHLKRFDNPSGYNALVGEKYKLTQEEYDLLKGVFNND